MCMSIHSFINSLFHINVFQQYQSIQSGTDDFANVTENGEDTKKINRCG